MHRGAKALLLAVVGTVVLGAIGSASASAALFHSEIGETYGFGQQVTQAVYTVNGGTMKCSVVTGTGTMIGLTAKKLPLTVTTEGCTAFGQKAERNMNGCSYEAEASEIFPLGVAYLICPPGKQVVVTLPAAGCSISTPAQSGQIEFKNEGSGKTRSVLVLSKESKLTYTSSGGACGASGSNGTITGTALVKGYKSATFTEQVGVWVE